jgi:hypothetical protein
MGSLREKCEEGDRSKSLKRIIKKKRKKELEIAFPAENACEC